jgi:class 3 adenylate cyclase
LARSDSASGGAETVSVEAAGATRGHRPHRERSTGVKAAGTGRKLRRRYPRSKLRCEAVSHSENLNAIKSLLSESYTRQDTSGVPKRADLTFGNTIKRVKHAVVLYVDMRSSRKIMQDATVFVSAKAHKAFLQSLIYCVENRDGHFRSFNGDGALAFFTGLNAASRAVCAAMDFKAYVLKVNDVLAAQGTSLDFGVGIGQGEVHVVKSGKRGDDQTKQDLIWIGWPVYVAVGLSDLGSSPHNIWISKVVRETIGKESHLWVVNNRNGESMWTRTTKTLKGLGSREVRYTSYYKTIF